MRPVGRVGQLPALLRLASPHRSHPHSTIPSLPCTTSLAPALRRLAHPCLPCCTRLDDAALCLATPFLPCLAVPPAPHRAWLCLLCLASPYFTHLRSTTRGLPHHALPDGRCFAHYSLGQTVPRFSLPA